MGNANAVFDAAASGQLDKLRTAVPDALDQPNPNAHHRTPLHAAAHNGHLAAVALLLERGSRSVDAAARSGDTPLHLAAMMGHADVVEALLGAGSALDAVNAQGETALHLAAMGGHLAAVQALLRAGCRTHDATDRYGRTALHVAAMRGRSAVVQALLRGGWLLDAADKYGMTALHLACTGGHAVAAEALLSAGSTAHDGTLRSAIVRHDKLIGQLLLAAGADSSLLPPDLRTWLAADRLLELRQRMFFSRSLLDVLLTVD